MNTLFTTTVIVATMARAAFASEPSAPVHHLAPPAAASTSIAAASHADQQIDALIDQAFRSREQREYVHAAWQWVTKQLATCPPSQTALSIQQYFNRLVAFMGQSEPRRESARYESLETLVNDMQAYVNNAINSCSNVVVW